MYGVPSGVVWDPAGDGRVDPSSSSSSIEAGYVVAAADVALALPSRPTAPTTTGSVEAIWVAPAAGHPAIGLSAVRALPGPGLEGDRHALGTGTFPSGLPGSALTLMEAEVVDSFDPPLAPDEHRRNVVTRGVDLRTLVGRTFAIGEVQVRGMRLCEPCLVIQRYARRPVLRVLVHRGGIRCDILSPGVIRVADPVQAHARDQLGRPCH